ncbi:transcriptional regulator prz1 [Favolaschia claudopus]|uniref:Transcriptional regulator prz1 n=1 Tax=Favolaschia claudopus TaxID=2862362 RepID=A0AAW0B2M1_9AGAR
MELEGEEEGDDWDGEYESEDEEDLAAYAAAAKQAIEAQLFNETPTPAPTPAPKKVQNSKEAAAISTVRTILAALEHDSLAQSTLAASKVPELSADNLLDALRNMSTSGTVPRGAALPISRFLLNLAKSEVLFGALRHSDASSLHLKRKREAADADERANKRLRIDNHSLTKEVAEAVRTISQTISTTQPLSATVISSIQPHLHRVFLFSHSSSSLPGRNTNALQEISGLIQVLGVISGTQIGQESQNILTAVYPCVVDGCGKFFSRLYSLRAHQAIHMWKCVGCDAVFPGRDVFDKHKTPAEGNQPKAECITAAPIEAKKAFRSEEEGEIEADVISEIQTAVLRLHTPLQTCVSRALGAPMSVPPTNGHATLASVIAQAQLAQSRAAPPPAAPTTLSSVYGLSDEQTKQVKEAITNAASAAQAEAEAQAALEEDEEDAEEDEEGAS